LVFAVRGSQVAIHDGKGIAETAIFIGTLDDRHCWAVDVDGREDEDDSAYCDVPYDNLMALWGSVDEVTWVVAGRAVQLVEWARTHRFCGRCGERTEQARGERARRCPACGLLAFPRLAPAVIVLVERGDGRALLARNARFPSSMYSCLAGFVEPGETLEQAVVREVREEVGIEVHDLCYLGSQPWPFPHSLMIGFTARWKSGEVAVDGKEISDARWFAPDDLPDIPPTMSIARHIIDSWLERARPE
jgi:NAD+ diphosphatase